MAAFTYMGTKKSLAKTIGALCEDIEPGPFFDLFSGISAAGSAIAPKRQIWCNDAQDFSRTLTEAIYLSKEDGPRVQVVADAVLRYGNRNLNSLISQIEQEVKTELDILWDGTAGQQIELQTLLVLKMAERQSALRANYSHCLFSTSFSGTYLGLVQSIQIDSIRFGIDKAAASGTISDEESRWAVLALCRALAAASNSTGHFAQYLTASTGNIRRVVAKRKQCVWYYWLEALKDTRPIGDANWRKSNRVFHGDANKVLEEIAGTRDCPAIIYADPPYTSDQYSRYYHLFETLILYDYPNASGKGQYRDDRFVSSFSLARQVEEAFSKMISTASQTGANLMISYPSNGLLKNSLQRIPELMSASFDVVLDPIIIPHNHSTMGGSKGKQKEPVEECIFMAL